MRQQRARATRVIEHPGHDYRGHLVGEIAEVDGEGRPAVVFPGHYALPTPARVALAGPGPEAPADWIGAPVLLAFEAGDPGRPIVVGLLGDRLPGAASPPDVEAGAPGAAADRDLVLDGERIVFDAEREIVLRCGESTITMTRDGRVAIRGRRLLSRATGPNRIRGASISLN